MFSYYRAALKISLAAIFLVVLAGSIVRMTGSGMGCPDWPTCFGYLIPPTDISQVSFSADKTYKKGQMIVQNDSLWFAKEEFVSNTSFEKQHWQHYTKHDYAIFNPVHTWIEFINRLIGALSGVPILIVVLLSFQFIRKKPILTALSIFTLLLLGFVAWLGKLVVDGNLIPNSISIHMLGALLIVTALTAQIAISNKEVIISQNVLKKTWLFSVLLFLLLVQFILGTQVREEVDYLFKSAFLRDTIIENLSIKFLIHRSSSLLVLIISIYLFTINKSLFSSKLNAVYKSFFTFIGLIIASGIVFNYLGFPAFVQPLHLVLGFAVFSSFFWIWLNIFYPKKN